MFKKVKGRANFISSNWKITKRVRHRQYDNVIIERMIGLVLGTSTTFHRPFLKLFTLTYKEMGTIWRTLSNSPQRQQDLDPCPSDCYSKLLQPLHLCSLTLGPSTALSSGYHYIFLILHLYLYNHRCFVYCIFITSPLEMAFFLVFFYINIFPF